MKQPVLKNFLDLAMDSQRIVPMIEAEGYEDPEVRKLLLSMATKMDGIGDPGELEGDNAETYHTLLQAVLCLAFGIGLKTHKKTFVVAAVKAAMGKSTKAPKAK